LVNLNFFVPWREWNAMISSKLLDLIQKQYKLVTNTRSILLSGFKNDENVKFNYSTIEAEEIMLENDVTKRNEEKSNEFPNMTVVQFMKFKYATT
jgi:hypothetical protein